MSEHSAEIRRLEEQIADLRRKDAEFAALAPEHRLAITLHKMLCHHNHMDGCGWEYEYESITKLPNWNGHAHAHYLRKARLVHACCQRLNIQTSDAIELLTIANSNV